MQLSTDEKLYFQLACGDRGNGPAQELLNVFAVSTAAGVLLQVSGAPRGLRAELATYVQKAIEEQKRRRN